MTVPHAATAETPERLTETGKPPVATAPGLPDDPTPLKATNTVMLIVADPAEPVAPTPVRFTLMISTVEPTETPAALAPATPVNTGETSPRVPIVPAEPVEASPDIVTDASPRTLTAPALPEPETPVRFTLGLTGAPPVGK